MPGVDRDLTSGQFPPLFDKVVPYSSFPTKLSVPSVWKGTDYLGSPDKEAKWIHRWTSEQVREIEEAAKAYQATGKSLTEIAKEHFRLGPELEAFLKGVREDLLNGKGFILFRDLPVDKWSIETVATAYMGLGTHLGHFVSQNGKGHILGHVKDLGNDPTQIHKVRIYSTNARQFFHSDDSDLVGLLCLHRAKEGGESDIISSHHIFNVLQCERPDVVQTLVEPNWYFDRKGERSQGQEEYFKAAIFYWYEGKLISKWDPYFVRSLTRFSDKGEIPPLSEEQKEAIDVLEKVCLREALHMILEVGDIQIVNNNTLFHARTAYTDHPTPLPRRQLMRLWLSVPESEGGWKLPFHDSDQKRRGGVQVNDQPHTSPLEAE